MEEEVKESSGDNPAAALPEAESSVDSGVDEKVCCAHLLSHFVVWLSLSALVNSENPHRVWWLFSLPVCESSGIVFSLGCLTLDISVKQELQNTCPLMKWQ